MDSTNISRDQLMRRDLKRLSEEAHKLLQDLAKCPDIYADLNVLYGGSLEDALEANASKLRQPVPVLIAGETSSGKSSFINLLMGFDLLPSHTLHCTSAIVTIQKGTDLKIIKDGAGAEDDYCHEDEASAAEVVKKELQTSVNAVKQKASLRRKASAKTKDAESLKPQPNYKVVNIRWPYDSEFLQDEIVIVDSPGFGEITEMNEILMEYLPKAFAFIYVINSANARGVQADRIKVVIDKQTEWNRKSKQGFLQPDRAIFICNKWDQVEEEEDVWEETMEQLEKVWPSFTQKQAIKFSVKSVKKSLSTAEDRRSSKPKLERSYNSYLEVKTMVTSVISTGLEVRLKACERWLTGFGQEISDRILFLREGAKKSAEEKNKMKQEYERNRRVLLTRANEDKDRLVKALEAKERDLANDCWSHLTSEQTKRDMFGWDDEDISKIEQCPSDERPDKAREIVLRRMSEVFEDYLTHATTFIESLNKLHAELNDNCKEIFQFLQEHQSPFKGVVTELSIIGNGSQERGREIAHASDDAVSIQKEKKRTAVIAAAVVSAPVWIPFFVAATVLGSPLIASRQIALKVREARAKNLLTTTAEHMLGTITRNDIQQQIRDAVTGSYVSEIEKMFQEELPKRINSLSMQYEQMSNSVEDPDQLEERYNVLQTASTPFSLQMEVFGLKYSSKLDSSALFPGQSFGCGPISSSFEALWKSDKEGALTVRKMCFTFEVFDPKSLQVAASIRYLSKVNNRNIRCLLDIAIEKETFVPLLIFESCEFSLLTYLKHHPTHICATSEEKGDAKQTYREIVHGVCTGLDFIHSTNHVHGNLKLSNILIATPNGDLVVKLADGFCVPDSSNLAGYNIKYCPPETQKSGMYFTKSDVFVLGVLLLEIWHGRDFFPATETAEDVQRKILDGLEKHINDFPGNHTDDTTLMILIRRCWSVNPEERPNATGMMSKFAEEPLELEIGNDFEEDSYVEHGSREEGYEDYWD